MKYDIFHVVCLVVHAHRMQNTQYAQDTLHHDLRHKTHVVECIIFHQKTHVPKANEQLHLDVYTHLQHRTHHMTFIIFHQKLSSNLPTHTHTQHT